MVEKLYVTYNDVRKKKQSTPPPRLDDEGGDAPQTRPTSNVISYEEVCESRKEL